MPEHDQGAIKALPLAAWGLGVVLVLLAVIFLVGGHFWVERERARTLKEGEYGGLHRAAVIQGSLEAASRLGSYKKLGDDGRVQIPIEQAMKVVVADYAKAAE